MPVRLIVGILSLVLVALPGAAWSAVADRSVAAGRCADVRVPLRNLKLEAKWQKPTVSIGDAAKLQVLVTRTAEEDPVTDEGHPWPTGRPMEEPVEGAVIGISMLVGDVFLSGGDVTNADGEAVVKVKIGSYTKPGVGNSRLYAEKVHTPPNFPSPSCRLMVFEYGTLDPAPKLKVVR